jgi:hypothetical protein
MYAHSNELEEVGVISLAGVNVESDPHKESLLGVSLCCQLAPRKSAYTSGPETILVYAIHGV